MTTVHVVYGECGEYSDYSMWIVRVFADKTEAERFAAECQRIHDARTVQTIHALDPECVWGWGGTKYTVAEIPAGWPMVEKIQ